MKNKRLLAGPYLFWSVSFVVIPLLVIVYYAFTSDEGSFTFSNLAQITTPENLKALGMSILLSFLSTAICLILAYPLAMILSQKQVNQTSFIVLVFILPMWMNFLLRTLAWQTLLEKNGVINSVLSFLHLPALEIINTPYAIILGMVYNFLPFMVLPIYNVLIKIDRNVINAARDLGANSVQTFWKVIFPLSIPGVISGITMVFVPALTTFVISDLLGGGKILLIGNVIEQSFKQNSNWHVGSGILIRKYLQKIYLALIFILLYAPIVTLIVLSFNQSKTRAKWGGFTLKWYKELLKNEQIMSAFYTTLIIAFVSAAIATVIGTAAAIAIQGMKQKWKTMYMGLTNIPMMNAEIVMGVSLMLLFIAFHMTLGFGTILIAHITFNIPYVILSVLPKLKQTNRYTYEAALDLGASPVKAFFKVVFPDIVPGVLSGFMLAFTMSLDDFVITHFTKGPGIDTLSTKIYTEVRKGIKPEIYALSTIMFVTVLVLLLLINYSPKEEEETVVRKKKVRKPSRVKKILIQRVVPVAICIVFIGGGFYYAKENDVMTGANILIRKS